MKICVSCSANEQIAPQFFRAAEELGRWIAAHGHTLVYGGVNKGLMECVAKAVHDAGGQTVGVIPQIALQRGGLSRYVDVEIPCDNLSDRKQLMQDMADAFVALPGGVGTLDEVFTVAAAATIGYHQKRVILYNIDGFWNQLLLLLDGLQQQGMVRGPWHENIGVAADLSELAALFS